MGIVLLGAFAYWQLVKKGIIKNAIAKAVSKGTGDAYFVKYDSSYIDEVGGNASFYNISLQSDSLQERLLTDDTAGIAKEIFNIRVEALNIRGANIPSFLKKNTVEANSIEIIKPIISISRSGNQQKIEMTKEDSLALYDRITGKFNSIQAGEIIIRDGTLTFANGKKTPHTIIQGININLKNLKIDSSRNYNNIISYFIKDINATAKSVSTTNEKNGNRFMLEGLQYNAPGRFIAVNWILQKDARNGEPLIELRNSRVSGISTNDFIVGRKIKADTISSGGGIISIYRSKTKENNAKEYVTIDNDFFDEVQVKNLRLDNTTLKIHNRENLQAGPMVIKNIRFKVNDIAEVQDGTNLKRLLGNSNWWIAGDGLSINTKDNLYRLTLGPFDLDNAKGTLKLSKFSFTPLISEAAFMKQQPHQKDQYNFVFNNIVLSGLDVAALMNNQQLIADNASLQPVIKIYNDRTLDFDTSSKVGLYPHQQLYKLAVPVHIKTMKVVNGYVSYRERGRISTQVGNVFFSNINATISNVCNIKEALAKNNIMELNASTQFLGFAPLSTTWRLPVNTANGSFTVSGEMGRFNAGKLTAITRPLGMAEIEKGNINKLRFGMSGDDYGSKGDLVILYNDLKVKMLKNTGDEKPDLQTKGVVTFIANLLMKDANPSGGKTRSAEIDFKRDTKKSFFNLLWKSVFQGTKKVASGKNDGD